MNDCGCAYENCERTAGSLDVAARGLVLGPTVNLPRHAAAVDLLAPRAAMRARLRACYGRRRARTRRRFWIATRGGGVAEDVKPDRAESRATDSPARGFRSSEPGASGATAAAPLVTAAFLAYCACCTDTATQNAWPHGRSHDWACAKPRNSSGARMTMDQLRHDDARDRPRRAN